MELGDQPVADNHIDGVVHGSAIQTGSVHGGLHIHVAGGVAEPEVVFAPPAGWQGLPELPNEVRSLLRAQIQAAQELPYRLRGARRPSMATVYVRQDLGSGSEDQPREQPRPTPILDSRGRLTDPPIGPVVRVTVRPPSRTVREALDGDAHMLVTGGPGLGKSTMSLRLAADVAGHWMSSAAEDPPLAEPVVPLRLTARALADRLDLPFPDAVADCVRVEYGALLGAPVDARVLGGRVVGCRWLLLVDGLDEVADNAERDRLVSILAGWASDVGSPYRVVLTTRPIEGAALAPLQRIGAARYELQPFDEEALRQFADNWFDDADHGYRFVRQIRVAHLDELVRVPLLATIAAIIFTEHGDRPLPDNQYELYESYLKYLRSARVLAPGKFGQTREPLLEHLGRVRLEADTSLVAAACGWAEQHLTELVEGWQEELVAYLASVGPFVHRGDDLGFLHHSFAEHLAATAKARLLPERFEPENPDFALLLHAARSDDRGRHARAVLLHHSRLHEVEADRLIGWLHTGGPDQHLLAAQLLAAHVPASAEVVEAFLKTVRAWAMTTHHPGDEILAQASRAAHHPGIAGWLADLTRDEEAPWQSRVEAATALATRLRGAEAPDAIALLRTVVDETGIAVEHRLVAAEALSECGDDERTASERGLRSVLTDPLATASECRNAALVLAGFGGPAREYAVGALMAMLDDSWTPEDDVVEAATGLVEIGVEFHERCAEIFRAILSSRRKSYYRWRDATIGLASLGPRQMSEAVTALTEQTADRRLHHSDRINAAETLAKLGPQHRIAAGRIIITIFADLNRDSSARSEVAGSLARIGCHEDALNLLREEVDDRTSSLNSRLWAARTLSDLGPEYEEEAAKTICYVADHSLARTYDRVAALDWLASSSGPHRASAVASLRDALADRDAAPEYRLEVADKIIDLGPEFHNDVIEIVLEIASCKSDPDVRVTAWRILRDFGARLRERAGVELRTLMGPDEAPSWESHGDYVVPNISDMDDIDSFAQLLIKILHDPLRSGDARISAAGTLVNLGRRHRRIVLDYVIEMIRSRVVPISKFYNVAATFLGFGPGPRAELAEVLRTVVRLPRPPAKVTCRVAEALALLDYGGDPEILRALRGVIADDLVDSDVRGDAALALVRAVPEEMPNVIAGVLRNDNSRSVYAWRRQVRDIAVLGGDVVPVLREVLADTDSGRREREMAAELLAQLRPELRDEALVELRLQAGDEFLDFTWRTDAVVQLAELDPETLDEAVAYHLKVKNDESQPVDDRCEAACQLVQLDDSFGEAALAALRGFATRPEFTVEEHERAASSFGTLRSDGDLEATSLRLAVARDPAVSSLVRSGISRQLSGRARVEMERSLLADRTASPIERVGDLNGWDHPARTAEAAQVLRDVISAPETFPRERIEAAAALGALSPQYVSEAVDLLEKLGAGQPAVAETRARLAENERAWRAEMLADALRVLNTETNSWRLRIEAAGVVWRLTSKPPESVVEHVRQLVHDPRVSGRERVEMLYALRGHDGLDQLRRIRDDEQVSPAVRRAAVNRLSDHSAEDRAAGVQVLNSIAAGMAYRPTLRWRAAANLMKFGERGRELGAVSLRALSVDKELPVIARVDAAVALGGARPDLRGEILRLLRGLRTTEKALARIQVFQAIGEYEVDEGVRALRAMAEDRTEWPGVRLRAAKAMAELRGDYRELAAGVAREVAHDERAPHHVRVKGARALARWSELCRAEGRSLLIELHEKWGRPPE